MTKIYEQLKDLHVRSIIFYGNTDDNYIYLDEAFTKPATEAQVKDAFLKKQFVLYGDEAYMIPATYANGNITITIGESTVSFSVKPKAE